MPTLRIYTAGATGGSECNPLRLYLERGVRALQGCLLGIRLIEVLLKVCVAGCSRKEDTYAANQSERVVVRRIGLVERNPTGQRRNAAIIGIGEQTGLLAVRIRNRNSLACRNERGVDVVGHIVGCADHAIQAGISEDVTVRVFDAKQIDRRRMSDVWWKMPADADWRNKPWPLLRGIQFVRIWVRLHFALCDCCLADLPNRARGECGTATIGKVSRCTGFCSCTVDGKIKRRWIANCHAGFNPHAKNCAIPVDHGNNRIVSSGRHNRAIQQLLHVRRCCCHAEHGALFKRLESQ